MPGRIAARARDAAWAWVLRHLNARDIALGIMVLAFPLAKAAENLRLIPRHHAYAAGAGTATVCGIALWWLQYRRQRRWRERGGGVLPGGQSRAVREEIAELRDRLDAQEEAWQAWCRAVPGLAANRRHRLRVLKDDGESA